MRLCTQCNEDPQAWGNHTAPAGRCGECGRTFDVHGDPIPDENVACPVHDPVLASCPHTRAEALEVPASASSWLPDRQR